MPLENVGKIIKIIIKKNNIEIIFDNFPTLIISSDTYTNHYLFVDKILKEEEYQKLVLEDKRNLILKKFIKLLSQKMYSEKEIIQKLNEKKVEFKLQKEIIEYLKAHNFLDDEKYAYECKEVLERKNYSKKKITEFLKKKGISSFIIDSIYFDEELEIEKAQKELNILLKKNLKKPYLKKVNDIKNTLYIKGFSLDIIELIIDKIEKNNPEEERKNLSQEVLKLISLNYDQEKIFKKLKSKGYNYYLIKEVLEEVK